MAHSSGYDANDNGRDSRDDDSQLTPRVAGLSTLRDYDVADDTPDPRGWTVVDSTGTEVGKVHDLIVDTAQLRTRYLDVKLDKDAVDISDDRDILIPVGQARLDDDDDRVVLGSLTGRQLTSLPAYTHDNIDRDYESSLLPNFDAGAVDATGGGDSGAAIGAMSEETIADAPVTNAGNRDTDFYDSHHFNDSGFGGRRRAAQGDEERITRSEEELAIGKRRTSAGAMNIRKRVETRHVSQPVTTSHEEVSIERHPVTSADASARGNIGADEIRIPVYEDEVVVDKRRVLKEEIVVKKQEVQDTQTVEADLRKERVDVDDSGVRNQGSPDSRRQM